MTRNPDGAELRRAKYDMIVADFMRRIDSDAVFQARLYGLGFRGVKLSEEFNYHRAVRYGVEQHETMNGKVIRLPEA